MKTIYKPFNGKLLKVNEPEHPNHVNFLIRFRGKDWSGFRTIAECEAQIPELEEKSNLDCFEIVEV